MDGTERYAWLCMNFLPYLGADSFLHLLHRYGSAVEAWRRPAAEVVDCLARSQAVSAWSKRRADAERAADEALAWAEKDGCRLLLLSDQDFPPMLAEGLTPPPVLFVRGDVRLLAKPSLAMVGSRHATPQAMRIARDFAAALSQQDVTVVSGMAAGIDTAAHQGALQGSGSTVAVWGTGIDRIYPPSNKDLAYQIAERGALVSEFPIGTRPLAGNFPRRNRLIAALSHATLVVEAAPESGSLITARLAGEMGREVMAVPGSIDNPHSKGCHKLIKEGAKLTECLDDIFAECPQLLHKPQQNAYSINKEAAAAEQETTAAAAFVPSEKTDLPDGRRAMLAVLPYGSKAEAAHQTGASKNAAGQESPANSLPPEQNTPVSDSLENGLAEQILTAMGYDAVHPDILAETLQQPAADIYAALLEMELDGKIAALSGGRYQRI
ncbi:MAG: DNA-processing protein DprA [Neisseria sp.]|nr:DNA-processing protein DprA [Neisseria sp.]